MRWTLRILLTLLLLLGLYFAQQQWRYQHAASEKQYQRATTIWPANDQGWYSLAAQTQFADFAASARAAKRAVQANPNNWQDWGMLAQAQIELGNMDAARQSMHEMAHHATGFAAHWQYANLLFLSGDTAGFWPQAIEALSFAPDAQILPALNQMWRFAQGDSSQFNGAITAAIHRAPDPQQPARIEIAAVLFYLQQKQLDAVAPWWTLASHSRHANREALSDAGTDYLASAAAAGQVSLGKQLWSSGVNSGLFAPGLGPSPTNLIASGNSSALGWQFYNAHGPWMANTAGTLSFTFHGNQRDTLALAGQRLLLDPEHAYRLSFRQSADASDLASNESAISGVHVEIEGRNNVLLQTGEGTFTTPPAAAPWTLVIAYQRPLGQVPFRGTVTIADLRLTRQ